jgi:hypothetical protein
MIATIATRMTPSLPPAPLRRDRGRRATRLAAHEKKAHELIPVPSSGSTTELPHVAKAAIEFLR